MPAPPSPPTALRARVLDAVRSEPVAARPVVARRRALAVIAGIGLSVGTLVAIGGPGGYGRPSGYYVTLAVLWLAVAVVGALGGVARGGSMLGYPASQRALVAGVTPAALAVTALLAAALVPPPAPPTGMHEHLRCVMYTFLMAVGPMVAFTFARAGTDPVAPRSTGAALGAVAGAIGALGIELRCSHAGLGHVVLAHVLPVAALAVVGALLAGPFVDVRPASPRR